MIKINLLPVNLRKKESTNKIPLSSIIFLCSLTILSLHIIFLLLNLHKNMQVISLNKKWDKMQVQFQQVDALKNNLSAKQDRAKAMEFVLKRDMYWTNLLNKINHAVPKGLWLNHLTISEKGLVIDGSVFSFGTDQVSLVNKFFNDLKNDIFFQQNFKNFNLDSVQRRAIKGYEVLDFLLTAETNKPAKDNSNKRKA